MPRKTLSHEDYSIGWISPLGCEHVAATAMLDGEEHSALPKQANDSNAYTLGSVGDHNVVIAPLPLKEKRNSLSARVASDMASTFRAIKIFLVVGIAGSASKEVRLGDVVVSTKVVKWDAGKYINGGRFEHNHIFKAPPVSALNQMSKLETTHKMFGTRIFSPYLTDMARKFPRLAQDYTDPSALGDVLFRSGYAHRAPRDAKHQVTIHYGLIASGDQVRFKDKDKGPVLCLEMEAAGLMGRDFVVIRGISDYADSHKNDAWQKYAAAVAAACAKEFLALIPAHAVGGAGKAGGGGDGSAAAPGSPQTGGVGVEEEEKSTPPPATRQWHPQIILRKSPVMVVALSHDSKLLAAGVQDTILLWDTATGTLQKTLTVTKLGVTREVGNFNSVEALAFSRDSKLLAWALRTSKWNIELCDLATGKCRGIHDGHRSRSVDGKIELWDMVTGRLHNTLEGHKGGVSCVAFSRDSRILASGSTDGNIKLWDTWTGHLRKTLVARPGVQSLVFMHGFTLLSSARKPDTIDLWDTETGQLQHAVPVSEDVGFVSMLLGSHDSRFFVSAATTRRLGGLRIWSQ
ncbi:vegetative incompatibility protein HET-E-1 [Parachaetomium inaequale]|uniref:Vegetative incompatibility protein HET-E-1 n=1 Tax=Parachaetomium inaequale TaxID=2588326 RepID=A0AAN6PJ54_9PEZI|nr:vegetative incompatibility protein HET-E-1 [Parachaetomium inaequale]